jgi:hypothetical protein
MKPMASRKYVYRGVHARHPMRAAALKGTVVPGDPEGDITPEEHNLLDESTASPFTSWSYSETIARRFAASRGPGGVLLCLPISNPGEEDAGWSWEQSPDVYDEQEILLRGIRMGAEVMPND